jgi:hypothetical protein
MGEPTQAGATRRQATSRDDGAGQLAYQATSSDSARRSNFTRKRKVGSSTLPLTTSCGLVSSALTSANAYWFLWYLQLLSDYDCHV